MAAPHVGLLIIELKIAGSDSLKDKRSVIKSLLAVSRREYNVSTAEIDHLDNWRRSELAFTCVSNRPSYCREVINSVLKYLDSLPEIEVTNSEIEQW
ncbi:MAG: DUF503 domain-containing protein [Armatimonadetes bacterium]|nr:DUF503 domain-containing protein [Armatimonadota bacterium]